MPVDRVHPQQAGAECDTPGLLAMVMTMPMRVPMVVVMPAGQ